VVLKVARLVAATEMKSVDVAIHTILTWSLTALLACSAQAAAPDGVAITGGTVITMTDAGVLDDYTILVTGETIVSSRVGGAVERSRGSSSRRHRCRCRGALPG
jgi:hypothetical protein